MVQWLRLCAPNAVGLGSIPGQGTRSHMHATTKILCAATKTQRSQINKNIKKKCFLRCFAASVYVILVGYLHVAKNANFVNHVKLY